MSIFRSGLFKDKVAIVTGETPVLQQTVKIGFTILN